MEEHIILRYSNTVAGPNSQQISDPPLYRYPFANFPTLKSHIHPRFAIVEAGRAFVNCSLPRAALIDAARAAGYVDEILAVEKIYEAWVQPSPDEADDNESFHFQRKNYRKGGGHTTDDDDDGDGSGGDDDDDEEEHEFDETKTESRRSSLRSANRRRDKDQEDVFSSRKRGRNPGGGGLTHDQLRTHTYQVGKRKRGSDLISEWAQDCAAADGHKLRKVYATDAEQSSVTFSVAGHKLISEIVAPGLGIVPWGRPEWSSDVMMDGGEDHKAG
ncbi:hypothetical protein DL93DRAFT_2171404 [Clavulina sp. PMI_390]|nr:hypothetical protein DL93DRAFT_2171404 [Clavulina sp. PMI_390]